MNVLAQDTWHLRVGSLNYDVIIPNMNYVIIQKVIDVILRPCLAILEKANPFKANTVKFNTVFTYLS